MAHRFGAVGWIAQTVLLAPVVHADKVPVGLGREAPLVAEGGEKLEKRELVKSLN